MEMGIGLARDAQKEIAEANDPDLRLLLVTRKWAPASADQYRGPMEGLLAANRRPRRLGRLLRRRLLLRARVAPHSGRAHRADRVKLGRHAHRTLDAAGRLCRRARLAPRIRVDATGRSHRHSCTSNGWRKRSTRPSSGSKPPARRWPAVPSFRPCPLIRRSCSRPMTCRIQPLFTTA